MPRTALFVIDIQVHLAQDATTEIPHAARIREAGTSILARARQAMDAASGVPEVQIVFVQHEESADRGPLVKGSKPWALVFKPRDGNAWEELVAKDARDVFSSNPHLATHLRTSGVATIVAFGIQSECCVLSTCRGALAAGFNVVVLNGAHSTYDIGSKPARAIEEDVESELARAGAEMVRWELWNPSI